MSASGSFAQRTTLDPGILSDQLDRPRSADRPVPHEPYVHVFSKDGKDFRRRAPANIFTETDLYTIRSPDGTRDLTFEHGLADLELAFTRVRRDFLSKKRQLPAVRHAKLMIFEATMHARMPFMRDHHANFWNAVRRTGEQMEKWARGASPEEKKATIVGGFQNLVVARFFNSAVTARSPRCMISAAPALRASSRVPLAGGNGSSVTQNHFACDNLFRPGCDRIR